MPQFTADANNITQPSGNHIQDLAKIGDLFEMVQNAGLDWFQALSDSPPKNT